jgi:hypothetical protein
LSLNGPKLAKNGSLKLLAKKLISLGRRIVVLVKSLEIEDDENGRRNVNETLGLNELIETGKTRKLEMVKISVLSNGEEVIEAVEEAHDVVDAEEWVVEAALTTIRRMTKSMAQEEVTVVVDTVEWRMVLEEEVVAGLVVEAVVVVGKAVEEHSQIERVGEMVTVVIVLSTFGKTVKPTHLPRRLLLKLIIGMNFHQQKTGTMKSTLVLWQTQKYSHRRLSLKELRL